MTHRHRPNPPTPARRSGGYTLVEMLIVIGIIVLLVGIALPAFRAITGGRSEEGATNQVTSMLARARADAIATQLPRGVAIFTDATGQCRVGEVGAVTFGVWTKPPPAGVINSAMLPFTKGTYVTYTPVGGTTGYYVCVQPVVANSATDIANTAYWYQFATSPELAWASAWASVSPVLYDQLPDTDPVGLPAGVGAQVLADDSLIGTGSTDRYLHDGVLIFDASGRLAYQQQVISKHGVIGSSVGFDLANVQRINPNLTSSSGYHLLDSSFGLVLYDREALANQGFPATEPTFVLSPGYGTVGSSPPSEADEEAWLDVNATPLLINRYTGALVRGE